MFIWNIELNGSFESELILTCKQWKYEYDTCNNVASALSDHLKTYIITL